MVLAVTDYESGILETIEANSGNTTCPVKLALNSTLVDTLVDESLLAVVHRDGTYSDNSSYSLSRTTDGTFIDAACHLDTTVSCTIVILFSKTSDSTDSTGIVESIVVESGIDHTRTHDVSCVLASCDSDDTIGNTRIEHTCDTSDSCTTCNITAIGIVNIVGIGVTPSDNTTGKVVGGSHGSRIDRLLACTPKQCTCNTSNLGNT